MAKPESTVRTSRYTVTCVPADSSPDAHVWELYAEERRDGRWVVTDGACFMDTGLTFHDRPYDECLHDEQTAIRLAQEAAPLVIVNGLTVPAALARLEAHRG